MKIVTETKFLTFATRPSALARWQTRHIIEKLSAAWDDLVCEEQVMETQGDITLDTPLPEIGGKGLFTYELEQALRAGRVHAAVHSLKDLPTEESPGLTIGLIPVRGDARDVLVCPAGYTLETLPPGSVVGTSSVRRSAQLLAYRPDLKIRPVRGNVDTRLRKVQAGQYDAILLAAAGVIRLGLEAAVSQYLSFDKMLPAPGQGALAVQCRADDGHTQTILRALEHPPTRLAVDAERAFLAALGGGCSLPVGAYATVEGEIIRFSGVVAAPDGSRLIHVAGEGHDAHSLGVEMARQALALGAQEVLV